MRPWAGFEVDGRVVALHAGDLVGRLETAALSLDDARISEAHALVSLRGGELQLLALRGRFAVDGVPQREVVLVPGLVVEFAPELCATVIEVHLPDEVLALEGDGLPRQVLGGVVSLFVAPEPRLAHRYEAGADATIWSRGEGWTLRIGGISKPLEAGDEFELGGRSFAAVAVSLLDSARAATRGGGFRPALEIEALFDSVHLRTQGEAALHLTGLSARLLSELVALQGPASWQVVAGELWPEETEPLLLRRKWDVALARLRRRLTEAGYPRELLRADRHGNVELVLEAGDRVVDRT